MALGWNLGRIGAPVNVFSIGRAVSGKDFTGGSRIGHDQPRAGQARSAHILAMAFAVVVNELPFIFDAIARSFVVFTVVEDLILLLARVGC